MDLWAWTVATVASFVRTVKFLLGLPEQAIAKALTYVLHSCSAICLTLQHRRFIILTKDVSWKYSWELVREVLRQEAEAKLKVRKPLVQSFYSFAWF